jgi:hypothetical protein
MNIEDIRLIIGNVNYVDDLRLNVAMQLTRSLRICFVQQKHQHPHDTRSCNTNMDQCFISTTMRMNVTVRCIVLHVMNR